MPPILNSLTIFSIDFMSFRPPFLRIVCKGLPIIKFLSEIANPIVLSPKSRPNKICPVLRLLIKFLPLLKNINIIKVKIDKNTTLKIAKLTRLRLNDQELDELSVQLSSILEWVEQLNEVNTDNVEPLSNISNSELPLRRDEHINKNKSEDILLNAPEKLENYFVVPKVVE